MPMTKTNNAIHKISESAFDFLERAIDEIKTHPKYSVINFATAIELLLKARLINEHWSLVVERSSDADRETFLAGKCKTVSPGEAIKRLAKVCGQPVPNDAAVQFEKLAAHRNRMIHFFHEAASEEATPELIEEVVKEQCLCWFHLEHLLEQWNDQFSQYEQQILRVRWSMRRNRAYLSIAFERLGPKIEEGKKAGLKFHACSGCGYEAAEMTELSDVLFENNCHVCGLSESYAEIQCPNECGQKIHVAGHGSDRTCSNCGHQVTAGELSDVLSTEYVDPVDYVQMNCALCVSLGSVVKHGEIYVCTECLETSDKIAGCGWCHERQMGGGDLDYSYQTGCEFCDGHAGWTRDD